MSVTSLITNGYICYRGQPIPVPEPTSLRTPDVVGVVEVRPKIRRIDAPTDAGDTRPVISSAQELKPSMTGEAPADAPVMDAPTPTAAQELRPKIIKAEEEE